MSTDELEKYKKIYSALVESLVNLHNKHIHFSAAPESHNAGIQIRGIIRDIQDLTRALRAQTKLVHIEGKKNFREHKRALREKKYNSGWKKRIKNDNDKSTPGSV